MKKIALLGLISIFIGLVMMGKDSILSFIDNYKELVVPTVTIGEKNEYYRDYDFSYVQNTDNFYPENKQDILNIYYTVINAGKDTFTFYCSKEYESCLDDVNSLANNQEELSDINNFVHPFNGFSHIKTVYDNLGKVTLNITKTYSEEDVLLINEKIDELLPRLVSNSSTVQENIKRIHDYIINNTKYDSLRSDEGINNYKSDIAYGPLFEGYAICGGYTDLMELFLEKLEVKNFKVASDKHIWNAVLLNDNWLHLDLTWDDPVANDGRDYLQYDYFLINTNNLLSIEATEHNFNFNIYQELKEA